MQLTLIIHTGGEEWDNQEVLAALLHPGNVRPTIYQAAYARHMTDIGRGEEFFDQRAWIEWLDENGDPDTLLIRADGLAPVALPWAVGLRLRVADAYFVGEYHTPHSDIAEWGSGAGGSA